MVGAKILLALYYFTQVIQYMVLVYVILSWFSKPGGRTYFLYQKLGELLNPLFMPFRRLTQGVTMRTGLDFTPFLLIIALSMLYRLIYMLAFRFII